MCACKTSNHHTLSPFAEILNFDWQSVEAAFYQPELSFVRAELSTCGWSQEISSQQAARMGRLRYDSLQPAQPYTLKVFLARQTLEFSFTTLPAPEGDCLCRFAAIANPHISHSYENRKGRLFRESASILREVVDHANQLSIDFALLAGDLTNVGQESEFQTGREILSQLNAPLICAPGDHDISASSPQLWQNFFPDQEYKYHQVGDFAILALDTHCGSLVESDRPWLKQLQATSKRKIIVSHLHLLPQPYLRRGAKNAAVKNFIDFAAELVFPGGCLLYAGHQNAPCRTQNGTIHQMHLPQPCQYLCSWYLVQIYQNGVYHKNIPIGSEILRQQSRLDGEAAVDLYQEEQWSGCYRRGLNPTESNFLLPPSPA